MFGEPVMRIRKGEPTFDAANRLTHTLEETLLPSAAFAPGDRNLDGETHEVGADKVRVAATLYFHEVIVDVLPSDQIRARGHVWDVFGAPGAWVDPWTGKPAGTVVHLLRHEVE